MHHPMRTASLTALLVATLGIAAAAPQVDVTPSATSVACHDFIEVTLRVSGSAVRHPFAEATVTGSFQRDDEKAVVVDGFCDAADGSVHRVRFMPSEPGNYRYAVTYREGGAEISHAGTFAATDARKKGVLRADSQFPGHYQWSGSQERFFWSGMVADGLESGANEDVRQRVDTLDRARITGIRVSLDGSVWATDTSPEKPAFHPPTWQACERLLQHARERDMVVAVAFASESGSDPRLIRHAVARFAAYRNLVWDLKPADLAPDAPWSGRADPYAHLASTPGTSVSHACAVQRACDNASTAACTACVRAAWAECLSGGYPTLDAATLGCAAGGGACGDDKLAALEPYAHLYDFFTGITWWELRPQPDLVVALHRHPNAQATTEAAGAPQAFAARNAEGDLAAIYVADGGVVTVRDELIKDQLKPLWFSPRDGGMRNARALRNRVYRTPTAEDWVLLFRTPCNCSFRDFDNEREY